ncbi:putative nuclease HARBI1 [Temnothorax nylanderi]|uniref:putative nuclease HARBI1 n=1 Tax=Temnothorax nylanderi TaxID=102681 RepID=UPI003A88A8E7
MFKKYLCMTTSQFEELLSLVGPLISKESTIRNPVPAAARLAMTLRYLATGDCMTSTAYQYLVGFTTASNIIGETCEALWNCLNKEVLPFPLKTTDWLNIAQEFENQWQFNHCIGAIDGKHILIKCPDNAGSAYFNYKNAHSIVLLGICDAKYIFTLVEIGAYGRRSDGGIFRDSIMGQKFNERQMNVPKPKRLTVDGMPLPYVFVGDEAFQLSDYLLRPYPGRGGLSQDRSIFNYRLSRARRTIENAFGILVSQWRILKRPIDATVDNTINMIKAIICLHNWLRKRDDTNEYVSPNMIDQYGSNGLIPASWRQEVGDSALQDVSIYGNHNSSRSAIAIREEFSDFFNGEGAVPWQYNRN